MTVGHICQLVCHDNYVKDSINFATAYFLDLSLENISMRKINDEHLFLNDLGF